MEACYCKKDTYLWWSHLNLKGGKFSAKKVLSLVSFFSGITRLSPSALQKHCSLFPYDFFSLGAGYSDGVHERRIAGWPAEEGTRPHRPRQGAKVSPTHSWGWLASVVPSRKSWFENLGNWIRGPWFLFSIQPTATTTGTLKFLPRSFSIFFWVRVFLNESKQGVFGTVTSSSLKVAFLWFFFIRDETSYLNSSLLSHFFSNASPSNTSPLQWWTPLAGSA